MKKYYIAILLLWVSGIGYARFIPSVTDFKVENHDNQVIISTNKACYAPGEEVIFSIDKHLSGNVTIRYRHLNEIIKEETCPDDNWKWTVPDSDFTGYLVDLYRIEDDGTEKIYGSIAVDVSSNWHRYPRYGFLSDYSWKSDSAVHAVLKKLNRYHINGIQFYDPQYKHHLPLAGTTENPDTFWLDIGKRETHLSTIKKYLEGVHQYGMKAMYYNLAYGALSDASADGVSDEWYLYTDSLHAVKEKFDLDDEMFKSDIWLLDPANREWQKYIAEKTNDLFKTLNFDGYHIDQLGDLETNLFDYSGEPLDLAATYKPFIEAMHAVMPGKELVMNSVNQYGQAGIAESPVEFLYTEVWPPNDSYERLAAIITDNDSLSKGEKNTVLPAYMNYDLAGNKGYFNKPAILLTNAVIFSFGGAHLELGEHMLCQPYFPNNNLTMSSDLEKSLITFYDFLVAYQNLLRDGGEFNSPVVTSPDGQRRIANWPPQKGSIAAVGKVVDQKQVLHLINFTNANSLLWRDDNGTQQYPYEIKDFKIQVQSDKTINNVWFASPDFIGGVAKRLEFVQTGTSVTVTIPEMKYWGMVVLE